MAPSLAAHDQRRVSSSVRILTYALIPIHTLVPVHLQSMHL